MGGVKFGGGRKGSDKGVISKRATQRIPLQQLRHQGVGEGATPFRELFHFTLDHYLVVLRVKQRGIKYHF